MRRASSNLILISIFSFLSLNPYVLDEALLAQSARCYDPIEQQWVECSPNTPDPPYTTDPGYPPDSGYPPEEPHPLVWVAIIGTTILSLAGISKILSKMQGLRQSKSTEQTKFSEPEIHFEPKIDMGVQRIKVRRLMGRHLIKREKVIK